MVSVSTSHLILFIASLTVAAGVAGTLIQGVEGVSSAIDERSLDVADEIRTDVEVISDPASPVYDTDGNGNVTLLVKNTGSQRLAADAGGVEVLLDGEFKSNVTVTVLDGSQWDTGNVARVEVSAPGLASGDHRVKLIVNGDEEVFEFRT
ncbi:MAG: flagellar protein G [Halobacteriales archaeon]